MLNDLVYALRNIAKQPLFYAVATVTLALGIGANAAIFTVVNAVLLRPLPYPQPDRLMMVWTYNPRQGFDKDVATYPNFEDWRRASTSFERMSAYSGASVTLTGSGDPAQIRGGRVTPDFFETLGVAPARGRAFAAANGQAGGERVVILAHGLWTRRFGARPVHHRPDDHAQRRLARSARRDAGELRPSGRRGVLGAACPGRAVRRAVQRPRVVLADGHRAAEARGHARGGPIRNGRHRHAAGERVSIERRDRNPPRADARRDRG